LTALNTEIPLILAKTLSSWLFLPYWSFFFYLLGSGKEKNIYIKKIIELFDIIGLP
jgi:hypothetical protein